MDTRTGEIHMLGPVDLAILKGHNDGDLIPIDLNDATAKQKAEMQVSKHDTKSTLGKVFTGNRSQRRAQEKAYTKSMRRRSN